MAEHDRRARENDPEPHGRELDEAEREGEPAPGKHTLTDGENFRGRLDARHVGRFTRVPPPRPRPQAQPISRDAIGPVTARDPDTEFTRAAAGAGGEVPFRARMERHFDVDFSSVRAFTGRATELAGLGARAATRGETIVFGPAAPDAHLVAHELAHVVQFRKSGGAGAGRAVSEPGDAAEAEAERAASLLHVPDTRLVIAATPSARILRDPNDAIPPPVLSRALIHATHYVSGLIDTRVMGMSLDWIVANASHVVDLVAGQLGMSREQLLAYGGGQLSGYVSSQLSIVRGYVSGLAETVLNSIHGVIAPMEPELVQAREQTWIEWGTGTPAPLTEAPDYLAWLERVKARKSLVDALSNDMMQTIAGTAVAMIPGVLLTWYGARGPGRIQRVLARVAADLAGPLVKGATFWSITTFAPALLPWASIISSATGTAARYGMAWALTPRRAGTEPALDDSIPLAGSLLRIKLDNVSSRYRMTGQGAFKVSGVPEENSATGDWFKPSGRVSFWMNDAVTPVALDDASQLVISVGGFAVSGFKGLFDIDLGLAGTASVKVRAVGGNEANGSLSGLTLSRGGWFAGDLAIADPLVQHTGLSITTGAGRVGPHFARGVELDASLTIKPEELNALFEGAETTAPLGKLQPYDPARAISFARRDVTLSQPITLKQDPSRIVTKQFTVESTATGLLLRGHGALSGNPKQGASTSAVYTIAWPDSGEQPKIESKIDRKPPKPEAQKDEGGEKLDGAQGSNLVVELDKGLRQTTFVGWGFKNSLYYFAKALTSFGIFALNVKQTAEPTLKEPPLPDEDGEVEKSKPKDQSGWMTRWLDYGSWTESQLKKLPTINFSLPEFPKIKLASPSNVAVRNAGGKPLVELLLAFDLEVAKDRGGSGFLKLLWMPFDAPYIILHGGFADANDNIRLEGIEADPEDGLSVARGRLHFDLPKAFGEGTPSFKTEVQWLRLGKRGIDFRTASAEVNNLDLHKLHIDSAKVDARPGASGKRFHVGAAATLAGVFDQPVSLHADVEWERHGNVTGSVGGKVARIDALGGKLAIDNPGVTATVGDTTLELQLEAEQLDLFKGEQNGLSLHDAQARFALPKPGKNDAPEWLAEFHVGHGELRLLDKVRVAATELKLAAQTGAGLKLSAEKLAVEVEGSDFSVTATGLSVDTNARKFLIELVEFTLPDPKTDVVHFDREPSSKATATRIRLEHVDLGALAARAMALRAQDRNPELQPKKVEEQKDQSEQKEKEKQPKEPSLKFKLSMEDAPTLRVGDDPQHPYLLVKLVKAQVGKEKQKSEAGGEEVANENESTVFEVEAAGEINVGSLHAKITGAKARVDLTNLKNFAIEVGAIDGTVGDSASFKLSSLKYAEEKLTLGSGTLGFKTLLGSVLPPDVAKLENVLLSIGGLTVDTKAKSIAIKQIAASAGAISLFERVKLEQIALALNDLGGAAPEAATDPLIGQWNGKLKIGRATVDIAGSVKPSAGAELEFGPGGVKSGRITGLQLGDEYGTGVTAGLISFRSDGFDMKDVGIKVNSETLTKSDFLAGARGHLESMLPDWILPGDFTVALVFDGSYTKGAGFKLGHLRPSLRAAKLKLFGQEGSFNRDTEKFGIKLGKKGTFSPTLQFPLYPGVGVEVRGIITYDLSAEANGGITKSGDAAAVNADAQLSGKVKAQIAAGAFGGVPHVFSVAGGLAAGLELTAAAKVKMEGLIQLPNETQKVGGGLGFDFRIGAADGKGPASVKVVAGPYVALTFLGFSHTFQFDLINAELFSFEAFGALSLAMGGMLRDGASEERFKKLPEPFPGYNLYVGKELQRGYQGTKKAILDAKMSIALKKLRRGFSEIEATEARIAEEEEWYQQVVQPQKLSKQSGEKPQQSMESEVVVEQKLETINWETDQKLDGQRHKNVETREQTIEKLDSEISGLKRDGKRTKKSEIKELKGKLKTYELDLVVLNDKLDQYQYQLLFAGDDHAEELLEEVDDVDGMIEEQDKKGEKRDEQPQEKKKPPTRLKRAVRGGKIFLHVVGQISKGQVWQALKQGRLSLKASATGRKPALEGDIVKRLDDRPHRGTLENDEKLQVLTPKDVGIKIGHKGQEIAKTHELIQTAQTAMDKAQNVDLDTEITEKRHERAKLTRMNDLSDNRLQTYERSERPVKKSEGHNVKDKVKDVLSVVKHRTESIVSSKVMSLGAELTESATKLLKSWYKAEKLLAEIEKSKQKAEQREKRLEQDRDEAVEKLKGVQEEVPVDRKGQQPAPSELDKESGHVPTSSGMSPREAERNFEAGFWQRRITLIDKQLRELQQARQLEKKDEQPQVELTDELARELVEVRQKWFEKIRKIAPDEVEEVRAQARKYLDELGVELREAQAALERERAAIASHESEQASLAAEAERLEKLHAAQEQAKLEKKTAPVKPEKVEEKPITGAKFVESEVGEKPLELNLKLDEKEGLGAVSPKQVEEAKRRAEEAKRAAEKSKRLVKRLELDEQVAARHLEEATRRLVFD